MSVARRLRKTTQSFMLNAHWCTLLQLVTRFALAPMMGDQPSSPV